jgi:hypothetical protein
VSAPQPGRDEYRSRSSGADRIADPAALAGRAFTGLPKELEVSIVDSQLVRSNASLTDMAELLRRQHTAKLDVVTPASGLRSTAGAWEIDGTGPTILQPDGVTTAPGIFRPTATCDAGIADRLGIPVAYLRRLREEHLGLYDANVNGWLTQQPDRQLLVRTLRPSQKDSSMDGGVGVARAVVSERDRFVDNLDVLLAVLDGIRTAGADVQVSRCDLTERRMYVQISSSAVAVQARTLLRDYVSPFTGARGAENPLVFAGFVLSNSETGHGSFSITPRLIAQVCANGYTITRDAMREVHLGSRLDAGVVQWSAGTQQAAITLITRQAGDAATTFLTEAYLRRSLDDIEARAGVTVRDVPATLKFVAAQLRFTEEQQATILDHFTGGADRTAGGVLQAITSAAQVQDDADTAYEMERVGLRAMALAAAHQS